MQLKLLCIVLFAHASFTIATPHGYGVKGGAAAKAVAGAAAGAIGGVSPDPSELPLGEGFSGSFSKSSSSSFASSSASSSSGTFSFSGSGLPVNNAGCTTGSCAGSIDGNPNLNTYNNGQNNGYNNGLQSGSLTGAAAQSGPLAGSQFNIPTCAGGSCSPKNQDCKGAQCGTNLASESNPVNTNYNIDTSNPSNCQSGYCGPTSPTKAPSDLPNCASGACSSPLNSPPKYEYNSNTNSGASVSTGGISGPNYSNSDKCPNGQCSKPLQSDKPYSNPGYDDIEVNINKNFNSKSKTTNSQSDDYEKSIGCPNGNCAFSPTFSSKPENSHNTQINPISGNSNCYSPNCKNEINNSYTAPSGTVTGQDYNKPATFLTTPKQGPSCTSPSCSTDHFVSGQNPTSSTNTNYGTQSTIQTDGKTTNCAGGKCNSQPNSYFTSNVLSPESKCNSPNCAGNPQYPSQQSTQPVPGGVPGYKPSIPSQTYSSSSSPSRPQGFPPSGPSFSSNQYTKPTHEYKAPNHDSLPAFIPLGSSSSIPCNGNDCSVKPGLSLTTNPNYPLLAPSKPISKDNEKPYTGSFGGPPGILKPNDFNTPNLPIINNKPFNPVPCTTGNCNLGQNGNKSPSGIYNSSPVGPQKVTNNFPVLNGIPSTQDSVPCSSGNCNYGQNAYGTIPSFNAAPCDTGNCGPKNVNGVILSGKPTIQGYNSEPCTSGNCNNAQNANRNPTIYNGVPCTTGKCGPQNQNLPVSDNKPAIQDYNTVPCLSGNCNHNQHSNKIPTEPNNGALCTVGNCGFQKVNSGTSISSSANAAAVASSKAGVYTGGFGGPPGLLKPYDDGKIEKAHTSSLVGKYSNTPQNAGHASSPTGIYSTFNGAGSNAAAFAAAGASAGAISGATHPSGHYGHPSGLSAGGENKIEGGCGGGCPGSGSSGSAHNLDHNAGLSLFGFANGLSAANAGAVSGANAGALGFGRSFASSGAVAHASSGAAIKGYGRR